MDFDPTQYIESHPFRLVFNQDLLTKLFGGIYSFLLALNFVGMNPVPSNMGFPNLS
jgi:hypothetical protein